MLNLNVIGVILTPNAVLPTPESRYSTFVGDASTGERYRAVGVTQYVRSSSRADYNISRKILFMIWDLQNSTQGEKNALDSARLFFAREKTMSF